LAPWMSQFEFAMAWLPLGEVALRGVLGTHAIGSHLLLCIFFFLDSGALVPNSTILDCVGHIF
jgi:hypothetical protein